MGKTKKGKEQQDLWTGKHYLVGRGMFEITSGDELFDGITCIHMNLFTCKHDLIINALVRPVIFGGTKYSETLQGTAVQVPNSAIKVLKIIAKRIYKYKTIKE